MRLCASTPIQSQTELAKYLQVNRSAVTQAKERGTVPERWVYKLARDFSLDPDWLGGGGDRRPEQNLSQPHAYHPVPLVQARLSEHGEFVPFNASQAPVPIAFHQQWIQSNGGMENLVLLPVHGDSMCPLVVDGDRVLVDQGQRDIISGRVYALGIGTSVLIRRIERYPGKLLLVSSNPNYPSMDVSVDDPCVCILGTIIWACRDVL
ncbi:MAG: S24 family peptidase [Desulfovermiculus sp.]